MNAIKIPYVLLASATELPFPDNHFDAVFTDLLAKEAPTL